MIKYVVKENKNKKSPAYGKWYAGNDGSLSPSQAHGGT